MKPIEDKSQFKCPSCNEPLGRVRLLGDSEADMTYTLACVSGGCDSLAAAYGTMADREETALKILEKAVEIEEEESQWVKNS